MKPLPKWLLALAIVLFAFYLLLIPEFGAVPFRGQRWEAGAPPPWRESSGWWGPRFGYGMMNGPSGTGVLSAFRAITAMVTMAVMATA